MCHEAAKRLLFGAGCAACKLDYWVERMSARQRRRDGKRRGKQCVDCGGRLQRLPFVKWVARMGAIRKVRGDDHWPECERRVDARI